MKKIFLVGSLALLLFVVCGCKSGNTSIVSYHTQQIECLGVELDGSETLRSWGNGRDRKDAVEQAWKNAVEAVLFKGILDGAQGCDVKPLLTEPNAREKYEDYFNRFFADNGEYRNYVSTKDEKLYSRNKYSNQQQVTYAVTVRVLRGELKKKLREDNILPN